MLYKTESEIQRMIAAQERNQEDRIEKIAADIVARPERKVILIAGPSSSGKTIFSHRLSLKLRERGLAPHPIAVDNYFVDREQTPRDADGNYDFECFEAVDIVLFQRHIRELLKGQTIAPPTFDFLTGKKEYKGNMLSLNEQDLLVIEGIHCLNDALTDLIPKERKYKIYIHAQSETRAESKILMEQTDGRLLRRMVRDAKKRGITADQTIAMWPRVRQGEKKNILPFQNEADVAFSSFLDYEPSVLKGYAEPILRQIGKDCPEYDQAERLLDILSGYQKIEEKNVPTNSLLREFIGGSCFSV